MKIPTDMLYKFWQQKVIWTARSVLLHLQDLVSLKCVLRVSVCVRERERARQWNRDCAQLHQLQVVCHAQCVTDKKNWKNSSDVCSTNDVVVCVSLPYASLSFCKCPHLPVWTSMSFSVEKDGSLTEAKEKNSESQRKQAKQWGGRRKKQTALWSSITHLY